ncbi:MAG: L,D-transpeptidase [Chitinophagaceae bacterium]|nr:L,D-transpeptidase [Chitinophagaceae bacterium]
MATKKQSSIPDLNRPEKLAKKTVSPRKKPLEAPEFLTDDSVDLEDWNALQAIKLKSEPGVAVSTCPQGKQKKVIRNDCALGGPIDKTNYIISLHVKLSTQNLKVTWKNGLVENWLCSPNPKLTPRIKDVIGLKCGVKHTNLKKDGMAWFTAIKKYYMAIGFHNSQPVGKGIYSHGCIRVSCEHARIINENSWSNKTTVTIVA